MLLLLMLLIKSVHAQTGSITGVVRSEEQPIEFALVMIEAINIYSKTDSSGIFTWTNIPYGDYLITASYMGYNPVSKSISINSNMTNLHVEFILTEQEFILDQVVVTGTKTFKRQTNSPVIVNVLSSKTIDNIQACNLSEGLKFQPGLRIETNCQTCNYTQLRMNGLAGGYSQILINGRPIFSPLTGLYGMEQLPANMIDRIEVVRGGGSSLYGSSAIGGTVNVITKIPKENSYELKYTYQNIDGQTNDNITSGNTTLVSRNKNSGISFFLNHRKRGFYDANQDNFSEIPLVQSAAIGTNLFFLPTDNQKVEASISNIHEYRFGGEMIRNKPAHLAQQAEERSHKVWMASADYQINFNKDRSSLITYMAWQHTDRTHFTGIQPDLATFELDDFITNPPYGVSNVSTFNIGTQLNHRVDNFLKGSNIMTLGIEYLYDAVLDQIPAYGYLIDQTSKDFGLFIQSDWEITPLFTLLSGVRMDKHNLVNKYIFSPRVSLLYKLFNTTQLRFSYGTGFRAPQAFDTDMHIAFAGGGVSRVTLSPNLGREESQSISTSINYDKVKENWIAGFTVEGFYNRLKNVFFLNPIGQDQHGELFEKQNGDGANVKGVTLEARVNYDQIIQMEGGVTIQSSQFDSPVEYIDGLPGIRAFTRTPNHYGYTILSITPRSRWTAVLNYNYTGRMKIPHFAGAPNQTIDEIINSNSFSEFGTRIGYKIPIEKKRCNIEIYGGIKNVFNAYQSDFDIGKNRDSNYIYGPSQPRVFYIGLKLKSN